MPNHLITESLTLLSCLPTSNPCVATERERDGYVMGRRTRTFCTRPAAPLRFDNDWSEKRVEKAEKQRDSRGDPDDALASVDLQLISAQRQQIRRACWMVVMDNKLKNCCWGC